MNAERNYDIQTNLIIRLERLYNILMVVFIIIISLMAFAFQIILHELPCPLCLLQRIGFIFIAFGALLNLRFQLSPSHYSLILISALLTSFISLRQIALHIIPGTGSYGMPIFGLHLYTWSFIFSTLIIIFTSIMLGVNCQYISANSSKETYSTTILFVLILAITIANIILVVLQCGFSVCPDNPTQYELMKYFQ